MANKSNPIASTKKKDLGNAAVKPKKSSGLPPQYANPFEWAQDWCKENGMSLPPDTTELRSLRNWFCFKLNQFKKGKLGEKNEALLAHYGLDFSQYEALNTGGGKRDSDRPFIEQLKQLKAITGSYDISLNSPGDLIEWQDKLLCRFESDGKSRRMKELFQDLQNFNFGIWLRPNDMKPSVEVQAWWDMAAQYEALAVRFSPHLGVQHPEMPKAMRDWATNQQSLAVRNELPKRANGWMRGVGLLINTARQRVGAERLQASMEKAGGEKSLNRYGANDRRLSSIRGATGAIVAVQRGRDDRYLMVEFNIDPPTAVALRKYITQNTDGNKWQKADIVACRMIALTYPNAFKPEFWTALSEFPQSRPATLTPSVESFGRLAWGVVNAFKTPVLKKQILKQRDAIEKHPPSAAVANQSSRMVIEARGDGEPLFKHIAQEWLDAHKGQWTSTTHKTTTSIVHKWLLPELGSIPIRSICEADICDHIESLNDVVSVQMRPLSDKSRSNLNIALNGILSEGLSKYGLAPLDSSKLPQVKIEAKETVIDPFTKNECRLLLESVRPDYSNFLRACIHSGLLVNELLDLKWNCVDFKNSRISLKGKIDGEGQDDSYQVVHRNVEIGHNWSQALIDQFQRTGNQCEYVFSTLVGTRLDAKNLHERIWVPLLRHTAIRHRGTRQLRNTAAMFWLDEGKPAVWIAEQMGLPSEHILNQRYRPLLSQFCDDAVDNTKPVQRTSVPKLRGIRNYANSAQTNHQHI